LVLDAFLGIPIHHGSELVAMVGLANKSGGYDLADIDFLAPICKTIAQLVQARRVDAERQRAQDALKATAALLAEKTQSLKNTLDSVSQGIVMMDPLGRITAFNQCALELLDLPDSLMGTGPNYTDVVRFQAARGDFGDNYAAVEETGRAYVAGAELSDAPVKFLRKTRSGRMLEVASRVLPCGDLVRTYADFTEQHEADNMLRESEARFRGLTALSSDWYCQQDENYRFVSFEGNLEHAGKPRETGTIGQIRWEIPTLNMSE
jgi:PAS domain-containing protein